MSRWGRIGRLLRTLAHLGPRQARAQVVYAARGIRPPPGAKGQLPNFSRGGTPESFLPGPDHARWLPSGELELIRRKVDFSRGVDWAYTGEGRLWLYHLNQCDHLRAPGLAPDECLGVMLDWVRGCLGGAGWDPHPTSLRILSWGKLFLTPGAIEPTEQEQAELRGSLARQLDHLDRNLEVRLGANHLLSNLLGVVFGGLLFEGPRADFWLRRANRLRAELSAQFGPDGAHEERSPMYHGLLLENLLDLMNLARSRPDRTPRGLLEALESTATAALGALSVWRHPDGEIALFGDSAFGVAHPPDTLIDYARSLGLTPGLPATPGLLETAGFGRLEGGPFALVVSVAGPAPAHQPGHAHCDALAFELVCKGQRVVCDTGVYGYEPGERRGVARATRSHATLEVLGEEQAEIWAAHRVGGRSKVELIDFETDRSLEATCAGWSTPDSLHRRRFSLGEGVLEIQDTLEGVVGSAILTLPLAPGIEPRLSDRDGVVEADMALREGGRLRVGLPLAVDWRIERTPYYPEFGREVERACLVGRTAAFETGTWRFYFSD